GWRIGAGRRETPGHGRGPAPTRTWEPGRESAVSAVGDVGAVDVLGLVVAPARQEVGRPACRATALAGERGVTIELQTPVVVLRGGPDTGTVNLAVHVVTTLVQHPLRVRRAGTRVPGRVRVGVHVVLARGSRSGRGRLAAGAGRDVGAVDVLGLVVAPARQ